jgi:hypothetical protein
MACKTYILVEAHRAGKKDQKVEISSDANGFVRSDAVGRRIQESAVPDERGGIGQPGRVPEREYFSPCGPACAGASIEALKRWGIEQKGLHGISVSILKMQNIPRCKSACQGTDMSRIGLFGHWFPTCRMEAIIPEEKSSGL